jgi:type IV pilus assembly protein PilE
MQTHDIAQIISKLTSHFAAQIEARSATPRALPAPAAGEAPINSEACAPRPDTAARKEGTKKRPSQAGFTLIELMIAVAVVGVLTSVAYPSFMDQVQRVRRTDAVVAMMQVQWAQERFRSNSASYGSLAEVGMPATSTAGHYSLQVSNNTANGYEVAATATGAQARDVQCSNLKLSMQGANAVYLSGPDAGVGNAEDTNRRCWSL